MAKLLVIMAISAALAALSPVGETWAAEAQKMSWYRCNTHMHTASFPGSDANVSTEYAAKWYKDHGYQCIVVTDHEHLTPVLRLNQKFGGKGDFLIIQGQEITQGIYANLDSKDIGWAHVNGLNTDKPIYPLGYPPPPPSGQLSDADLITYEGAFPTDKTLAQTYIANIDRIYAAGGIPQVNHPTGPRLAELMQIKRPFLYEVWNAFPSIGALGGVQDNGVVSPSFEAMWDGLLSVGKTVYGVASDDTHDYINFDNRTAPTPGKAWIMVEAPTLTLTAIMDALRHGHFYASTGVILKTYQVDAKGISITIDPPLGWDSTTKANVLYRTRFIGRDGKVLAKVTGLAAHYVFKGDEAYVRASIIDSDGGRAWTQPVFRDGRSDELN